MPLKKKIIYLSYCAILASLTINVEATAEEDEPRQYSSTKFLTSPIRQAGGHVLSGIQKGHSLIRKADHWMDKHPWVALSLGGISLCGIITTPELIFNDNISLGFFTLLASTKAVEYTLVGTEHVIDQAFNLILRPSLKKDSVLSQKNSKKNNHHDQSIPMARYGIYHPYMIISESIFIAASLYNSSIFSFLNTHDDLLPDADSMVSIFEKLDLSLYAYSVYYHFKELKNYYKNGVIEHKNAPFASFIDMFLLDYQLFFLINNLLQPESSEEIITLLYYISSTSSILMKFSCIYKIIENGSEYLINHLAPKPKTQKNKKMSNAIKMYLDSFNINTPQFKVSLKPRRIIPEKKSLHEDFSQEVFNSDSYSINDTRDISSMKTVFSKKTKEKNRKNCQINNVITPKKNSAHKNLDPEVLDILWDINETFQPKEVTQSEFNRLVKRIAEKKNITYENGSKNKMNLGNNTIELPHGGKDNFKQNYRGRRAQVNLLKALLTGMSKEEKLLYFEKTRENTMKFSFKGFMEAALFKRT